MLVETRLESVIHKIIKAPKIVFIPIGDDIVIKQRADEYAFIGSSTRPSIFASSHPYN